MVILWEKLITHIFNHYSTKLIYTTVIHCYIFFIPKNMKQALKLWSRLSIATLKHYLPRKAES